jgi:hypothetical protein
MERKSDGDGRTGSGGEGIELSAGEAGLVEGEATVDVTGVSSHAIRHATCLLLSACSV